MKAIRILLLSIILAGSIMPVPRDVVAASTVLQVTARVLPSLTLSAEQHAITYQVEKADLQRGYIDLNNAMTVHLKTNMTRDIAIGLNTNGRILARESGSHSYTEGVITISPDGLRPGNPIIRAIDYRVMLDENTIEGPHVLEVALSPAI